MPTVTYNGNTNTGGTAPVDSTDYAASATVRVKWRGTLVKTSNVFRAWNTAADGSGTFYHEDQDFEIAANLTLYAIWGSGATYTLNGTYMDCTGPQITTAGIAAAVVANPACGTVVSNTSGTIPVYIFTARLRIGTAALPGSASIWDCSKQYVKVNVTGADELQVRGIIRMGDRNDGTSNGGGAMAINLGASDRWKFYLLGRLHAYGSNIYSNTRIRMETDTAWYAMDCDLELEDGVSPGDGSSYGQRQDIKYDDSRIHHTAAVGVKLYSLETVEANKGRFSLARTKVQSCLHAFQVGQQLPVTLRDVKIDTCTNHVIGNQGVGCSVTFINPDFTVLRVNGGGATVDDIYRVEFRYTMTLTDVSGAAQSGIRVRALDQQGSARFNALTNASGNPTGAPETLQGRTYAGTTGTVRENHTIDIRSPNRLFQRLSRVASRDINDPIVVFPDAAYTQSDATALAHTGITITDHGGSPVSWNSLNWGITVTGNLTTNPSLTATDIYHYLKYHLAQDATIGGKNGLDWHQLALPGYETARSDASYYAGVIKGVRVVTQAGNPFPGFTRFQSDSGTYYTPPLSVLVQVTAVDVDGLPVQNARVHLEAGAGGPLAQGTVILSGLTDVNGIVQDAGFVFTSNQPTQKGRVRKASSVPYFKPSTVSGTITSGGLIATVVMIEDA
jgi:hypothetical protein